MDLLDSVLLSIDPYAKEPEESKNPIKIGDVVDSFAMELYTGRSVEIDHFLHNGPVLLNFIRGTWCLFCRAHMRKVKAWLESTKVNVTVVFVSNEDRNKIRAWKEKSGSTGLFVSDPDQEVIQRFGLEFTTAECSKPAMFLLDKDRTIRLAHYEKRNSNMYEQIEEELTSDKKAKAA